MKLVKKYILCIENSAEYMMMKIVIESERFRLNGKISMIKEIVFH